MLLDVSLAISLSQEVNLAVEGFASLQEVNLAVERLASLQEVNLAVERFASSQEVNLAVGRFASLVFAKTMVQFELLVFGDGSKNRVVVQME